MSTPRERLFLAQNPLFRRILLDRNFCSDTSERYGLPELTLRAPESKNRTGLQESEPACAESRSGRLVTTCRTPFVVRWNAETGSGEPAPVNRDLGLLRPAARTVRDWGKPGCF
jgi:hypothetical protein